MSPERAQLPLVAIVGRPNVGKSTLFNRLLGRRQAIVDAEAGLTRDRLYGTSDWGGREFSVVDTAGLDGQARGELVENTQRGTAAALEEADAIIFLVDVGGGLTAPAPRWRRCCVGVAARWSWPPTKRRVPRTRATSMSCTHWASMSRCRSRPSRVVAPVSCWTALSRCCRRQRKKAPVKPGRRCRSASSADPMLASRLCSTPCSATSAAWWRRCRAPPETPSTRNLR